MIEKEIEINLEIYVPTMLERYQKWIILEMMGFIDKVVYNNENNKIQVWINSPEKEINNPYGIKHVPEMQKNNRISDYDNKYNFSNNNNPNYFYNKL